MTSKAYFVLNTCERCGRETLEEVQYSGGKLWIQHYCPSCIKKNPMVEIVIKILEAKPMEKKEIIKAVKKLDPKLKPSETAFKVACVLLASAHHGAHEPTLAKLLDIPLDDVQVWGERLRASKVWVGRQLNVEWLHPDIGGIAFWCDAQVAMGLLVRSKDGKYNMSDEGKRYVEKGFKGELQ